MKKKNIFIKIMAFLALFGIIIGVIGTGILILFSGNNNETSSQTLTPEQYEQIQKLIKENTGSLQAQTGTITLTGITK
ncbi:hypothetical protein LRZ95_00725 [Candidatus Gracilibacteria bacterium]|nr:hypothetical protein [Candidatus Gracilibacteria bacterium]